MTGSSLCQSPPKWTLCTSYPLGQTWGLSGETQTLLSIFIFLIDRLALGSWCCIMSEISLPTLLSVFVIDSKFLVPSHYPTDLLYHSSLCPAFLWKAHFFSQSQGIIFVVLLLWKLGEVLQASVTRFLARVWVKVSRAADSSAARDASLSLLDTHSRRRQGALRHLALQMLSHIYILPPSRAQSLWPLPKPASSLICILSLLDDFPSEDAQEFCLCKGLMSKFQEQAEKTSKDDGKVHIQNL